MYMVRQFASLTEMERFLNVDSPKDSDVVGFNIIEFNNQHEYIVIIKYETR